MQSYQTKGGWWWYQCFVFSGWYTIDWVKCSLFKMDYHKNSLLLKHHVYGNCQIVCNCQMRDIDIFRLFKYSDVDFPLNWLLKCYSNISLMYVMFARVYEQRTVFWRLPCIITNAQLCDDNLYFIFARDCIKLPWVISLSIIFLSFKTETMKHTPHCFVAMYHHTMKLKLQTKKITSIYL